MTEIYLCGLCSCQEILRRNGRVSIVTCPAPNLKHMGGERTAEAQDALRHRMAKVLDLLAVAGTRTIILGAWGTGVFGHDPAAVAADWRQVLSSRFRGAFDRVIFAIIDAQTHAIFSAVRLAGRAADGVVVRKKK